MAGNNTYSNFTSDVVGYIADETLPLVQRQLVAYQFGDPLTFEKGRGLTYTATRYLRLPLPFAPLAEGVGPAQGESLTINQVSATCQQWGDKVVITDVAEMTIYHPLFQKAIELVALQMGETLERNTFNALLAGTQINYVNARGSRAALQAGDVLDTATVIRTNQALVTIGAPRFMGQDQTDAKMDVDAGGGRASNNPRAMPHYSAIIHPAVAADFRNSSTVITAWSYSDINRLYNFEIGEWSGIRFCEFNMVPSFTGVALVQGTGVTSGGALAGAANYYVQVTGSDTQNQYESRIYQVSAAITNITTGSTNSITLTTPTTTGFTYSVYVGTTTSPANLGLSTSGPTSGPLTGQAVQIPPNTAVTITGIGLAQVPPAAPATAQVVYPTFVFGKGAYGQVVLDNAKFSYLKDADKSDVLNQLRVVGWKLFYSSIILNQLFFARIESVSTYNTTFG